MTIIAESGSTKTNWLTEKHELYQTIGFNPLFHSTESIYNEMMKHAELVNIRTHFKRVFFYGASCSSPARNKTVADALKKFFTEAETISVDHDLKAAAVATYSGGTGIVGILGTGSNSGLYNGKDLTEVVPALGYVLGDEGSGAYFGKKLMALYLYKQLPAETAKLLEDKYKVEKEKIIESVYQKPHANVYLAGYAKVLSESPDKEFMDEMVEQGFTQFFKYHVCCYENYKQYPVHFVGSIAFFMKPILEKVAEKFGCHLGNINREPVYKLLEWHMKQ
ncbi:MAG TPA: hypothetical protein VG603_06340 [Chitinophagales bacterium]|nr:hypothetical protein [Chitinophagales bacterium]